LKGAIYGPSVCSIASFGGAVLEEGGWDEEEESKRDYWIKMGKNGQTFGGKLTFRTLFILYMYTFPSLPNILYT
jgi:hypothetical protein